MHINRTVIKLTSVMKYVFINLFSVHVLDLWTHGSLVMPYGNIELGLHLLQWWLVGAWHQAITRTNVDLLSMMSFAINYSIIYRVIFTWKKKISILKMCLKVVHLKSQKVSAKGQWIKQPGQRFKIIFFLMGPSDPQAMILMGSRALGMGPIIDHFIH